MIYFAHGDEIHETVTQTTNKGSLAMTLLVIAVVLLGLIALRNLNKKPSADSKNNYKQ